MTQVSYTTAYKRGKIHVTITFPDGATIQHSIPRGVLESQDDPQAELERIITDRANREDWPDTGTPPEIADSGRITLQTEQFRRGPQSN